MIKLTAVTLQGQGVPVQQWDIFVNYLNILTMTRESGKTKIVMNGGVTIYVLEKPQDVIAIICKARGK